MPFWSITNVLILELAIIRRILSENACPKQHFSQPATLRDSWCPTLSISTDTRVPREVLGGGGSKLRFPEGLRASPTAPYRPPLLRSVHGERRNDRLPPQQSFLGDTAKIPHCLASPSLDALYMPSWPAGPPALAPTPACSKLIPSESLTKEYLRRKQWQDLKITFKIFC